MTPPLKNIKNSTISSIYCEIKVDLNCKSASIRVPNKNKSKHVFDKILFCPGQRCRSISCNGKLVVCAVAIFQIKPSALSSPIEPPSL